MTAGRSPFTLALLSAGIVLVVGVPIMMWNRSAQDTAAVARDEATRLPTTADVQSLDQLWREIDKLQKQAAELGEPEFTTQAVRLTTDFLELDEDDADDFRTTVDAALLELDAARENMRLANVEILSLPEGDEATLLRRDSWARWQEEQRAAADGLLAALSAGPRHRMLAEERLIWLLRLDYSIQAARKAAG